MKALLIESKVTGIVNLENIKFFLFENVKEFKEIENQLYKKGCTTRDYKYCTFNDDDFVPAIFKLKDGIYNQMQAFNIERIKFDDLPITNDEKEAMVKKIISKKRAMEKKQLVEKGEEAMLYAQVDTEKEADVLEIVTKLKELDEPIDYTEYLNELV